VETVELLGAERLVHARLGDEQLIIRTHEDQGAPTIGSPIHAKPREDRMHWFNAETGQRL
jgi:sn-glycerol 3-phosphate transport system ATP-binding protein